jgi:hypothetical protein
MEAKAVPGVSDEWPKRTDPELSDEEEKRMSDEVVAILRACGANLVSSQERMAIAFLRAPRELLEKIRAELEDQDQKENLT